MRFLWVVFILISFGVRAQPDVEFLPFANGLSAPVGIANAGDERLFVIEQDGRIKIVNPNGDVEPVPFLDISSQVNSGGERGLLGLAFAPDYCVTGKFFVNYTYLNNGQLTTRIARFLVSDDDKNKANPLSQAVVLEYVQPFTNHNGGHLAFGPDGHLYISSGDGGSGGDPQGNAQNKNVFLGKILRIDVSDLPYTSPPDNPFVGQDGLDEIWAYGLRNPWRFSFDALTGDMFIADVGQQTNEEVNFEAAGFAGGANYGWNCYEGNSEYQAGNCNGENDLIFPVFEYNHSAGDCSITGGEVYRGSSFDALWGKYFMSDLCSGKHRLLWKEGDTWQNMELSQTTAGIVAYASDVWGELYAVSAGSGTLWRITESSGNLQNHIVHISENTLKSTLSGSGFKWFKNGSEILGENGQTLEISEPGIYAVVITSAAGCEIHANPIEVLSVGLTALNKDFEYRVFPNPARGLLQISLKSDAQPPEYIWVQMFSIHGKKVLSEKVQFSSGAVTINTDHLAGGVYFLRLYGGVNRISSTCKVIVE